MRTVKTGMFVRSFVRKVITFCEEDMRGNHVPVGKDVLNDRFLGFEKFLKSFEIFREKSTQSVHINADCSWLKSGFEPVMIKFDELLVNFFETLKGFDVDCVTG